MGRFPQKHPSTGSGKWTQLLANDSTELIDAQLKATCGLRSDTAIEWVSPVKEDEYSEYRDQSFVDRLGIRLKDRPLNAFWPSRGPQWGGLARTNRGEILLVESKSTIPELISPPITASNHAHEIIGASLRETQAFLGVDTSVDWSGPLYQYASRLAHLYLFRVLNRIPALLVFLYFVGDTEVNGPATQQEWTAPLKVVKGMLGLPSDHRLSEHVVEFFVDVTEIEKNKLAARS